ncbi:Hint domain-containing protein [Tritonibacter horizontis]|uniref:Hedgehog/Intein (Hint) domain-containing protein n=1 Tax=Tritonibacter horizontis TaxID=1768241 RepID=A0A132C0K3_9RHOB|nr:Hint domain-containing protein [Tritonibacter horizontis]KUP94115.1 hypothetical protein TRIHO_10090 [Tritonibacter horizontis]
MLDWFAKRNASPMAEAFTTAFPLVSTGHAGVLVGTMVATATGWRPVEALAIGDEVLTFDHGMRPVKSVERQTLVIGDTACAQEMAPIYIPRDALGNRNPMWVKPEQGLLIEHDLLEDKLGDPFAVVPACALEGYRGITRAPQQVTMETVVLAFDEDEVIYIEAGVLAFCPVGHDLMHDCITDAAQDLYTLLSATEARELVLDMITEDTFWTAGAINGSGGTGEPQYATYA